MKTWAKWVGITLALTLTALAMWSVYVSEDQANNVAYGAGVVVAYALFGAVVIGLAVTPVWLVARWWRRR